jgi:hypothetical protein
MTVYFYEAFYKDKRRTVTAETSYQAQNMAAEFWRVPAKQRYQVAVMLVATADHQPVIHNGKLFIINTTNRSAT